MSIKDTLKRVHLVNQLRTYLGWNKYKPLNSMPDGHFYSPIVSKLDLDGYEEQIWGEGDLEVIPNIDLNVENQIQLVQCFERYYSDLSFVKGEEAGKRFLVDNRSFRHTDAIILYSFIRHFSPKRIVEVGSGFSSALMLDTREVYNLDTSFTFIEPYPALLNSLLRKKDIDRCTILPHKVQDVELSLFEQLDKNDILFIDSSHVSKTGSDVNHELFKILPVLKEGVIVHFHDIFYPFEYPKEWVREGRNWNENYLLRAFLSYNDKFEIMLFNDFIHKHHKSAFKSMPLSYKNTGGSIWLRKK